jgi:hypothetical protein
MPAVRYPLGAAVASSTHPSIAAACHTRSDVSREGGTI